MTFLVLFCSVAVGAIAVLIWRPEDKRKIKLMTAFGGAYILSVTSLHLLPEVFGEGMDHKSAHGFPFMGLCLLAGFFIQLILDYLSEGIEHGHAHHHSHDGSIPWGMMVGLCLHAYLEGTPLAHQHHIGHAHALPDSVHDALLMGIVMHNVPVSIVFMSLLLHGGIKKGKALLLMGVFALMSPLGMLTAEYVEFIAQYQRQLMAIVIGIFLHISTTILFETGEAHKFNIQKFLAILAGAAIAIAGATFHSH